MSEPAIYRLLTIHVPNLMSTFLSSGRLYKESFQVRGPSWHFVTKLFLRWGVVSPTPNPQAGGPPLSAIRDCLFNLFAATLHIWLPSHWSATRGRAMPWWHGTHLTWRDTHM
jgi:hypothetical protein